MANEIAFDSRFLGLTRMSMKINLANKQNIDKLVIRKCHQCGHLNSGHSEPQKCNSCKKSFLPSNYFSKVHAQSPSEYNELFAAGHELTEEDIVKGITVLW